MSETLTHAVRTAIGDAQLHQATADVATILAEFHDTKGTDRSIHARAMHLAQQQLDALNANMLRSYGMNPPQAWTDRYASAAASLAWERRAD